MSLILSLYEKRQRILCCPSFEDLFFLLSSKWLVILNSVELELVQHAVLSEESVMWSQKHGFNAAVMHRSSFQSRTSLDRKACKINPSFCLRSHCPLNSVTRKVTRRCRQKNSLPVQCKMCGTCYLVPRAADGASVLTLEGS